MSDFDHEAYKDHPALKDFSRTGFMVKHVAGKALKFGIIGGLAIGGLAMVPGLAVTGTGGLLAMGAGLFSDTAAQWISGASTHAAYSALTTGAGFGGTVGAIAGGAWSLTGASDAADKEEQRLIANYERAEQRASHSDAMSIARQKQILALQQQARDLGINPQEITNPNKGLPNLGGDGRGMSA